MIALYLIPVKILVLSSITCGMTVRIVYVGLNIITCRLIRMNVKQLVRKGYNIITDFSFDNTTIHSGYSVPLRFTFDHLLTFNNHIAEIGRMSDRQLAILKCPGDLLTLKCKLFIKCIYCPLL